MNRLIVVFSTRIPIGLTATPYEAKMYPTGSITLQEQITPDHKKVTAEQYTDSERDVIELLGRISDQSLFKKFSREKNIKDFKDKVTDEILKERIRPDIEKTIYRLIQHLRFHSIPAYFKREGYPQLYTSDRLKIKPTPALPIFRFNLKEASLAYTLMLKQDDFQFTPSGKKAEIICRQPAVIKINHDIFHFEDFSAAKLKPFFDKPVLTIAEQHIPAYMESFVAGCIRLHEVEATGFEIEKATCSPASILALEKDLTQRPVLNLYFEYGDHRFQAGLKTPVFADLKHNRDGYTFRKIPRDFAREQSVIKCIEDLGLLKTGEATFSHPDDIQTQSDKTIQGPENMIEWVRRHEKALKLNNIDTQLQCDGKTYSKAQATPHFETREATDWFELEAMVEIPPFNIPFIRFRKHILRGERQYTLPNGEIFILPEEWMHRFTDLFHFSKEQDNALTISKLHLPILSEAIDSDQQNDVPRMPKHDDHHKESLPSNLKATLRPYQEEGYHWINFLVKNRFGGILADDMGLGKTIQAITFLLNTYQQSAGRGGIPASTQLDLFDQRAGTFNQTRLAPTLIVMPTSLVHNWAAELKRFAPDLKVNIFTGTNRARSYEVSRIFRHYHIVITTYGVLRNDIDYFRDYEFNNLILDESQQIKNPSSKSFAAVKAVKARHHLVLTGTPIENSLVDLWAQMNVVNQDLLGTLPFFKKHYVDPISRSGDLEKSDHLQKLIRPFMLRRTKEMVARDLPPKMEQIIYCEMTPEQKKFYEKEKSAIRNSIFETIDQGSPASYGILALKSLTRLRQIANHPVTVEPAYPGESGKFNRIMESLEDIIAGNHHILVFSSFVKDLRIIEEALKARHIGYSTLTGATRNRREVIANFNRDKGCKVFLISLKAGGVGLNLTKADYVFMLNPWWNPAAESQAINRAHRIGQERNVFVYRFISTRTIEEKIAILQEKKSEMANTFVKNNNPLSHMDPEEIKELFR